MENKFNCGEAKKIDMVDYLARAGHHPKRVRDNDYWYLSPLRNERTASFKINRKFNCWYDHGMGKGGNIIDFALLFHNCTISDWLHSLKGNFLGHEAPVNAVKESQKLITIEDAFPIISPALISYLKQRNISLSLAKKFCVEMQYKFQGRTYYGIGFKNDLGGYEIRNPFYKNSSSPKGITTIKNSHKKVAVFEGFFDFLSFTSLHATLPVNTYSYCILNSLSFFESAAGFISAHQDQYFFLDNDKAGRNCRRVAMKLYPNAVDCSRLYKGFKDMNEWWSDPKIPP
jgi:hypothetical protein